MTPVRPAVGDHSFSWVCSAPPSRVLTVRCGACGLWESRSWGSPPSGGLTALAAEAARSASAAYPGPCADVALLLLAEEVMLR